MKEILSKIKEKISGSSSYDIPDEFGEDYLEVDLQNLPKQQTKVIVKPYVARTFADVNEPLNDLREGLTIALINIKHLKEQDILELKRFVSKLKKTTEAINGDIAGFGDDWLVATPNFAKVFRQKPGEVEE